MGHRDVFSVASNGFPDLTESDKIVEFPRVPFMCRHHCFSIDLAATQTRSCTLNNTTGLRYLPTSPFVSKPTSCRRLRFNDKAVGDVAFRNR
jgi:hypothetical protein